MRPPRRTLALVLLRVLLLIHPSCAAVPPTSAAAAAAPPALPVCAPPPQPLPCVAGYDGRPCVRRRDCPGRWVLRVPGNLSLGVVWLHEDPRCRFFVEDSGEVALSFRGRTVTWLGDSLTQHQREQIFNLMLECKGSSSWHEFGEEMRVACGWTYSPQRRNSLNYDLGAAMGGIRWRSFFVNYMNLFFEPDRTNFVNDTWADVFLGQDAVAEGGQGVIMLNAGAWDLAYRKPFNLIEDINRTIEALRPLSVGRHAPGHTLVWRSLMRAERPPNTEGPNTWERVVPYIHQTNAMWREAGYPVVPMDGISEYMDWDSAVGPTQNLITMDGLHPFRPIAAKIGQFIMSFVFEHITLGPIGGASEPSSGLLGVAARGSSNGGDAPLFEAHASSFAAADVGGEEGAASRMRALAAAAALLSMAAVLAWRWLRRPSATVKLESADCDLESSPQSPLPQRTLYCSGNPRHLLVLTALGICAAIVFSSGALEVSRLGDSLRTPSPLGAVGSQFDRSSDGVGRGVGAVPRGDVSPVVCETVRRATQWLQPQACVSASGVTITRCNDGAIASLHSSTYATHVIDRIPREPPGCRYSIETAAEAALALHGTTLLFLGSDCAAPLLLQTASMLWTCSDVWQPGATLWMNPWDRVASMPGAVGADANGMQYNFTPARRAAVRVCGEVVDGAAFAAAASASAGPAGVTASSGGRVLRWHNSYAGGTGAVGLGGLFYEGGKPPSDAASVAAWVGAAKELLTAAAAPLTSSEGGAAEPRRVVIFVSLGGVAAAETGGPSLLPLALADALSASDGVRVYWHSGNMRCAGGGSVAVAAPRPPSVGAETRSNGTVADSEAEFRRDGIVPIELNIDVRAPGAAAPLLNWVYAQDVERCGGGQ